MLLRERSFDSGAAVRLGRAGSDARITQPLVRRQRFEQTDCSVEEIGDFFRGLVTSVTFRIESRDTSAVFAPLVLPEGFGRAGVGGPVFLHVLQQRWVGSLEDG